MVVHLGPLVPSDRTSELGGERADGFGHDGCDIGRGFVSWEVQEQHVAGGALDQGAHGRTAAGTEDQVTLPVPGHRPVLDLSRTIADHDHVRDPRAVSLAALSLAGDATTAQTARELAPEFASALDKEGLVDRLVAHPHHRIVRELLAQ